MKEIKRAIAKTILRSGMLKKLFGVKMRYVSVPADDNNGRPVWERAKIITEDAYGRITDSRPITRAEFEKMTANGRKAPPQAPTQSPATIQELFSNSRDDRRQPEAPGPSSNPLPQARSVTRLP